MKYKLFRKQYKKKIRKWLIKKTSIKKKRYYHKIKIMRLRRQRFNKI